MKSLKVGTLFAMPIPLEGKYLYGYVVYNGSFVLSNIFDYIGDSALIPKDIEEKTLLYRDLMHGTSQFRKFMQRNDDRLCYCFLSKQKVKAPLPPKTEYVLHGESRIYNYIERKYENRFASDADKELYQSEAIHYPSYYPHLLYAKILGKAVKFDSDKKAYVII